MDFIPANVANGVVPTSAAVVYTVPSGVTVMLRSTLLVNKIASNVIVNMRVSIGAGGVLRYVIPKDLLLRVGQKFEDSSSIFLPAGSTIELSCSIASSVDYIISGVTSV